MKSTSLVHVTGGHTILPREVFPESWASHHNSVSAYNSVKAIHRQKPGKSTPHPTTFFLEGRLNKPESDEGG